MITVGERVWFFDETAMHHNALVTKVNKDDTLDIEYEYKGKTYRERKIPRKEDVKVIKTHPTQKRPDGKPRNWNVVTMCWKKMAIQGQ